MAYKVVNKTAPRDFCAVAAPVYTQQLERVEKALQLSRGNTTTTAPSTPSEPKPDVLLWVGVGVIALSVVVGAVGIPFVEMQARKKHRASRQKEDATIRRLTQSSKPQGSPSSGGFSFFGSRQPLAVPPPRAAPPPIAPKPAPRVW
jgi:hypothetical protein